jgi:hypothetical protein
MGVYEALPTPAALLTASYITFSAQGGSSRSPIWATPLVVPAYTATELEDSYQKGGAHWMRSMNRNGRGVRTSRGCPYT